MLDVANFQGLRHDEVRRIPLLGTWVPRVLQRSPTCYRCMMHPLHVAVRHLRCLAYLRRTRRHTCRTFLSGTPNSRTFLSGSTSRLRRRLAIRTRSTSFSKEWGAPTV